MNDDIVWVPGALVVLSAVAAIVALVTLIISDRRRYASRRSHQGPQGRTSGMAPTSNAAGAIKVYAGLGAVRVYPGTGNPVLTPQLLNAFHATAPKPPTPPEPALVAGPIVAYRVWHSGASSGYYGATGYGPAYFHHPSHVGLFPVAAGASDSWTPGAPLEARCTQSEGHTVPDVACGCGFWAVKTLAMLQQVLGGYGGFAQGCVVGKVALWGDVIEHELGYRARYAYPLALYRRRLPEPTPLPRMPGFPEVDVDRTTAVEKIAAKYGIPVLDMPDEIS